MKIYKANGVGASCIGLPEIVKLRMRLRNGDIVDLVVIDKDKAELIVVERR